MSRHLWLAGGVLLLGVALACLAVWPDSYRTSRGVEGEPLRGYSIAVRYTCGSGGVWAETGTEALAVPPARFAYTAHPAFSWGENPNLYGSMGFYCCDSAIGTYRVRGLVAPLWFVALLAGAGSWGCLRLARGWHA